MIKVNCPKVAKNLFILLIVSLVFAISISTSAYALTSETINFQGKIVRNDTGHEGLNVIPGTPACVVDGAGNDTCDFQVAYYTASTGGTLLLTEKFNNVEIGQYDGVFELSLGSGSMTTTSQCRDGTCNTPMEVISEYNDLYVELKFAPDGTNLTETFTRMPLEASPYAMFSKYAEGAHDAFKLSTSLSSTSQSNPITGMIYYNTTDSKMKVYNGTAWENVNLWTDAGTFTYLTSTTDDLVLGASTGGADGIFYFDMNASDGSYFDVNDTSSNRLFTILSSGNVGIGTATPGAKLEVAGSASTITNASGDLTISTGGLNGNILLSPHGTGSVRANSPFGIRETGTTPTFYTYFVGGDQTADVTYTLPTADGTVSGQVLTTNASGVLSWTTVATGAPRWNEILAPNGNLSLAHAGYTTLFTFDSITDATGFGMSSSSLTTGYVLGLSTTSTALTTGGLLSISATGAPAAAWSGALAKIEYDNADADVDGSALKLGLLGTTALGSGTVLNITTSQTGTGALALRVNDDGTYTDTTPFVIDSGGQVGIGTPTPGYNLHVVGTFLTGSGNRYVTIGSSGVVTSRYDDNGIKTTLVLENRSSAYGDEGVQALFNLSAGSGVAAGAGSINVAKEQAWTSTPSTQDSYLSISTRLDGTLAEKLRLTSAGNFGIGVTSPTAYLHLKAGTTAANTAPLKFTTGVNLTTAESGAMEWDGSRLYITDTTPTRNTIAYTSDIPTSDNYQYWTARADSGTDQNVTSQYILDLEGSGGIATSIAANKITIGTTGVLEDLNTLGAATAADQFVVSTAAGVFAYESGSTVRTSLGATTVGSNLFTLTNPSAITFLRVNADNTVSALNASDFRTAIGAGTGSGTVTSVTAGTGLTADTNPITTTGTISFDYTKTLTSAALGADVTMFGSTGILFEGSTSDGNMTLLTVTDPTGDNTITLPNSTGTVALTSQIPTVYWSRGSGYLYPTTAGDDIVKNTTGDLGLTGTRWDNLFIADSGSGSIHIGSSATDEGIISYDTSNNILKFDTDSTTNADISFLTDDLYLDKSAGRVGIGITTPGYILDVAGSVRLGATGVDNTIYIPGSGATRTLYTSGDGLLTNGRFQATGDLISSTKLRAPVIASGSNSKDVIYIAENSGNTYATIGIGTSAVPASYQTIISNASTQTGLVTLVLKGITSQTGDLFRWIDSSNNVLGVIDASGDVGIGVASPTAVLHLKAGTAGANTAPLKFTTGVNLTTAESGAMEWDGSRLYITNSTPTRNTIAYLTDIVADTDNYVDSVSFNTSDGILTLGRTGILADLTADLDGRYALSSAGSLFTDSGAITWLTSTTDDFSIGGNNTLVAPFSVDVSANTVRIGTGATTSAVLNMYASDGDTGSITYTTNDLWEYSGGSISVNGGAISVSTTNSAIGFGQSGAVGYLTAGDYTEVNTTHGASWNGTQWIDSLGAYSAERLALGANGLVFYTGSDQAGGNPVTWTEKFRLTKTGEVGIGTSSPDYALQVNGVIAPETDTQDLGTSALSWDLYANAIYDSDGDIGTNGQVLSSTASGTNWIAAGGSGTVTNIATGVGLTGGPITTIGTISFSYSETLATDTLSANQTVFGSTGIILEGTTDNTFQTLLTLTDPTADNTITFPNASGTVALTSDLAGLGSLFTDSGAITWLTSTTDDFSIGGNNTLVAPFSVDVSANTVRMGTGATASAVLNMYASDGDTGSITYNTNDAWAFSGGDMTVSGSIVSSSYVQGTSFRGGLYYVDDRTIAPVDFNAVEVNYVFTSYSNNNTSPWADGFVLRGYGDATGGSDNMLTYSRSSIAARMWQQTYGSATAFTTYEEFAFTGTGGTANYIPKYTDANTIGNSAIYDNSGNIGIGDTSPASLFTVGSGDLFQVDSTGDMVKIKNVTYSWPSANAVGMLTNNGSGTLSWTDLNAGDELLPTGTEGQMLYNNAGVWTSHSGTYWDDTNSRLGVGTTSPSGKIHSYISNSAVTATQYTGYFENLATNTTTDAINKYGMYITSTGTYTGLTGTATNNYGLYVDTPTGGDNNYAAIFEGGNVGIGTASPSTALHVTGIIRQDDSYGVAARGMNAGYFSSTTNLTLSAGNTTGSIILNAGPSERARIDGATGYVGIGEASPASLFTVGSGDLFQVDSTGDMVKIKNVTYSWPSANAVGMLTNNGSGTLSWTNLNAGDELLPTGTEGQMLYNNAGVWTSHSGTYWDDTNNRLGVGTASPSGKIHSYISNSAVTATQYTGYFENLATNTTTDAINKYGMYITSTGTYTGLTGTATNNYGLYVDTPTGADNNYAAIFEGGNVGIGTASPNAKLEISYSQSSPIQNALRLLPTGTVDVNMSSYFGSGSLPSGILMAVSNFDGSTAPYHLYYKSGESALPYRLDLWKNTSMLSNATDVYFDSGDVGIGTTSPDYALQVNGTIAPESLGQDLGSAGSALRWDVFGNTADFTNYIDSTADVFNIIGYSLTSGSALRVSSTSASTSGTVAQIGLNNASGAASASVLTLTNSYTSNTGTTLLLNHYATGTGNLALRVNDVSGDTTPFVIDGGGNVGIGTTSPSTLLQLGTAGTLAGTLSLAGVTSGLVTIDTLSDAGTWTLTLPANDGDNQQVLTTDGSGNTSWTTVATGSSALSAITAATTTNTIGSGDNGAQIWNWALTTADRVAFTFGESSASTATGTPVILSAATVANSTAIPLFVKNYGNAASFRVDDVSGDTTPFIIDASGNVGIGTASPGAKLEISGDVLFSSGANRLISIANNTSDGNSLTIKAGSSSGGSGSELGGHLTLVSGAGGPEGSSGDVFIYPGDGTGQVYLAYNGTTVVGEVLSGSIGIFPNNNITFRDADGSHYSGFQASSTTTSNSIYTLPATYPGTNGYILSSTTAGALSWAADNTGTDDQRWDEIGNPTLDKTFSMTDKVTAFEFNSVSTTNAFSISSTSLTTGTLLNLSSTTTLTSGAVLKVSNTATTGLTGNMVDVSGSLTTGAGSLLAVTANGINGTGNGLKITSSTTGALTNGLVYVNGSAAHTGNLVNVVTATATGVGLNVTSNSLTSGSGLKVVSSTTGALTNGLVYVNGSAAHTGNLVNVVTATATGIGLNVVGNALTTGTLTTLSSTSTALTTGGLLSISATGAPAAAWTGDLAKIEYTNADADVDGSALKLGLLGTTALGSGTVLNITTSQEGTGALALRVNDDGTYTDTTPVVVDMTGKVGIGLVDPTQLLDVNGAMRLRGQLYDYNNSVGTPGEVLSTTATGVDWITLAAGHNAVTLAGENYLSIDGSQVITANDISLTTNVTGTLPIANGGTNATTYTASKFLWYNGTSIVSSGYDQNSFATTSQLYWTRNGTDLNVYPTTSGDDVYLPTNSILGVGYNTTAITGGVAAFNGNVGIGTSSPDTLLEIVQDSATYNPNSYNVPTLYLTASDVLWDYSGIGFKNASANRESFFGVVEGSSNDLSDFVFQGYDGTSHTYKEFMRINDSGKVGIGTDTPSNKFVVNSTAYSTIELQYNGTSVVDIFSNDTSNIFIGFDSGSVISTGIGNVALGDNVLAGNTTGSNNTAVGYYALQSNVAKQGSTAFGYEAMMYADSTATEGLTYNTAIGYQALTGSATAANNTGTSNTAVGHQSLTGNTSGSYNVGLGVNTLNANTTGTQNIAIGYNALFSNVAKKGSVAIGYEAMRYADSTASGSTSNNTAVGYQALLGSGTPANNTGTDNSIFGAQAGYSITSGYGNSFFGSNAGRSNTTGYGNTSMGYDSLNENSTGIYNVVMGWTALGTNSTGNQNYTVAIGGASMTEAGGATSGNVAVGYGTLYSVSGSYNTAIGYGAGELLTSGSSNILIGRSVDAPSYTGSSQLNIGNVLYGINVATGNTPSSTGKIGIGTTNPTSMFSVGSSSQFQVDSTGDMVKIKNVTYSWPSANAVGMLTNNGSGTLSWTDLNAGDELLPTGTEGQMLYNNAGVWTSHSGTYWDDTNSRLGVGTTSPSEKLEVNGFILAKRGQMQFDSYYGEEFINSNPAGYTEDTASCAGDTKGWSFDEGATYRIREGQAGYEDTIWLRNDTGSTGYGLLYTGSSLTASNLLFSVSNLPNTMIKMRIDTSISNIQAWAGLSSAYTATTSDFPNGIFFTNGSAGGTTWVGKTCSSSTCTTVSSCGTVTAGKTVIFFIKVNSTTSVDFYMDADISDGISLSYCGNSSTNIPTGTRLGGSIKTNVTGTTSIYTAVDYFRVWQDDPITTVAQESVSIPSINEYDSVSGADIAENYPVAESEEIQPGTIVSTVGGALPFIGITRVQNDKNAIGVVSTSPNMTLGASTYDYEGDMGTARVALSGRVPVRIDPDSQPIKAGDYITSSGKDGMGQKAIKKGIVVGKALEDWSPETGKEKILMFVNLIYFDPFAYESTPSVSINDSGWYKVAKLDGEDDYSKIKINNSSIGSSQNLILSVDTTNGTENINVVSNFTSGGYDISKARINTENGTKYLEVYIGEANGNNVKVSLDSQNSNWISTPISRVEGDISGLKEFEFSGVLFGVSDIFAIEETGLKVNGDLISSNINSNMGDSINRWNDIYAKGTIRIGSGVDGEGAIRFNVEKKVLEFSNDGSTWLPLGNLSSQSVLSPEYPGAILYADGGDNYGVMTSDAEQSSGSFRNYYEWVSDKDTPQDYDILVRVTLPDDFVSWKEDAIYLDFMTENSGSLIDNKVDMYLMGGSGVDAQAMDGISAMPSTWQRMSIKGMDINDCNDAGSTCTLRISVSSSFDYFVRVGDITLNYNRGL